ncbi:MAG: hypothetical protein LJE74_10180 [Proteobacteria bacterium]|nr:hypothetical protein [Pseudomonadota bacterium]
MNSLQPISRWRAFLIHLGISLVSISIPAYFILVKWYPFPYFTTDGGWQGIRIVAAVSLVLGPLLTLLVYKHGKPGLKMDLTLIALVQAAALVWGVWTTYNERPVALVYTINYFTPVAAYQMRKLGYDPKQLDAFGTNNPIPVYADIPTDPDGQQEYRRQAVSSGVPLYLFYTLYRKFTPEYLALLKQQSDVLYDWLESRPEGRQALEALYQIRPELVDQYLFVPLHSRYKRSIIVLDINSLDYVGSLDIDTTKFLLGKKIKKKTPDKALSG